MLVALEELLGEFSFTVQVLDVDADRGLEEKYGELVPVLELEGKELCHYFLDAAKVREVLAAFR